MRLDKYLKLTRIIKRRTVSKNVIDIGKVTINGKVAKPSANVKEQDLITLSFINKEVTIQVLSINERESFHDLYRIIAEKSIENLLEE